MPGDSGTRPRVALATSGIFTQGDAQLLSPLRALGFDAESVVWSNPEVRWSAYAAVVIRSCWDYHRRLPEFLGWTERLETSHVPLINSGAIVRWNSSKTYLVDLENKGIAIPPTAIVRRGATADDIFRAVAKLRASEIVVKPAVSASAYETWRTRAPLSPGDGKRLFDMASGADVIVQSFVEAIVRAGELSLIFFDGVFSHAVKKSPKAGDFRVQAEHGGKVEPTRVPPEIVEHAAQILRHAPAIPVYARIDGIVDAGVLTLMELECIEPELFLPPEGVAAGAFASAIARAIDAH